MARPIITHQMLLHLTGAYPHIETLDATSVQTTPSPGGTDMGRIRRSDFARSSFMLLALTVWLGACHKWVEVAPPDLALEQQAK
jgi:hypothetical protein